MIRSITFNTGKVLDTKKKRNKLDNKRATYILVPEYKNISKDFLINFVKTKIKEFYEFKNINLMVCGDSAKWIRMLAQELNAEYITDKYHSIKILRKALGYNKKSRKKLKIYYYQALRYFYKGYYDDLMKLLIKLKVSKETIKYFKSIKLGILNQGKYWNIGASAESDVYHLVKSGCNGARIFSYNHFVNMLNQKCYNLNNRN